MFVTALFGLGMAVVTLFGTHPFPREYSNSENGLVILPTGKNNMENDDTPEATSQEHETETG
ncbi:MAG: hypothetical protein SVT56_08020 [Chloroflexota bacterium]|nr:hypothetical protein [Chloroflexota bacterium]